MTNILEKILKDKKHSLDMIKKKYSLNQLEKNIQEFDFYDFKMPR